MEVEKGAFLTSLVSALVTVVCNRRRFIIMQPEGILTLTAESPHDPQVLEGALVRGFKSVSPDVNLEADMGT